MHMLCAPDTCSGSLQRGVQCFTYCVSATQPLPQLCSETMGKMSSPGFQRKIRDNAKKFEFQAEVRSMAP